MQSNYFMEMYTMQSQSGQTQITAIPAINSHSVLTIPNITAIIEADAHTVTNTNAQTDSNTGSDANNSISPQGSVNILCSTILNPSSQHQHIHQRHEHHNNQNQQRCDNSFMNDDDDTISNHQHSHVCGMCGNTFRKTSGLKRHMRIHVIEQGLALKINNEGGSEHPYKCNACKVEYPNASSFEQHIQNEHTQPQALKCTQCGCFRPILLTSVSPFRCETCTDRTGDVFQSSGIIKYQITANVSNPVAAQQIHVTHSKAIKLEIPSLLQGIRLVEYGHARRPRKQHQCSECEKSYKHQSTLAMHKKVHSGEYKYKCEYCDKEFYLTEYYNRHMRVHTKEKPYRCDVCDKSFSQSNTLTQHKRIHTGEKPYACTMCEKTFSVKDYLNKHIRTHTGEKPFECDFCGKKYTQRSGLRTHQKTHFPDHIIQHEEELSSSPGQEAQSHQTQTQNILQQPQTVSVRII